MVCAECEYLKREDGFPNGRTGWRCMADVEERVVAVLPARCVKSHVWCAPSWCAVNKAVVIKGVAYETS